LVQGAGSGSGDRSAHKPADGDRRRPDAPGRFTRVKTCEVDQAPGRHDFSLTNVTDVDVASTYSTTDVRTVQERQGWLSFIGIGPSENQTTRTTLTNARTFDIDTTNTSVQTLSHSWFSSIASG
jgi:hypothetical protein